MQAVIQATGLTRRFGAREAVEGLDLEIPAGQVSAFLGPNGAGKTTTIRMLLGLLRPHGGRCEVLGRPPGHPEGLAQVGALVEMPSLYDHLTGEENVRVTQMLRGLPRSEVSRVLGLVGLAREARRPAQTYSLGMRQRLGLALALLGEPKLLILDEPTNGMDPAGILEIRELLRTLPERTGAAVFLSSHLLAEVEQVAQHLVVLHRGRLRYQGPLAALGAGLETRVRVRVQEPGRAQEALGALGHRVEALEDHLRVWAPAEAVPDLAAALVRAGAGVLELAPEHPNLETRFLALLEEGA